MGGDFQSRRQRVSLAKVSTRESGWSEGPGPDHSDAARLFSFSVRYREENEQSGKSHSTWTGVPSKITSNTRTSEPQRRQGRNRGTAVSCSSRASPARSRSTSTGGATASRAMIFSRRLARSRSCRCTAASVVFRSAHEKQRKRPVTQFTRQARQRCFMPRLYVVMLELQSQGGIIHAWNQKILRPKKQPAS